MGRFTNWIRGLFNRFMDRVEDPEAMLDQARRDMNAALISNQEKAVQAITQRNQLEVMLRDAKAKSQNLENQAVVALKQGDRDLARALLRDKANTDSNIENLEVNFQQASKTVDTIKLAINQQREEVAKKTSEALTLKTQWKQAQIQNSIAKALDGLSFENNYEGFGAAQEKIRQAQSEANARTELQSESLQGRMMAMQSKVMDSQAEDELQKLEMRLGMRQSETAPAVSADTSVMAPIQQTVSNNGTPAPANPAADAAIQSEADRQLDELEKRLKGS